jgi:hypothetical protein
MAPRFLIRMAGRNLPKIIRQAPEPQLSIVSKKIIADFERAVEQTGILKQDPPAPEE